MNFIFLSFSVLLAKSYLHEMIFKKIILLQLSTFVKFSSILSYLMNQALDVYFLCVCVI